MKKITKSRRGFFFTLALIFLVIPLIYLVSFYSSTSETKMQDTVGKMRCDELHYFIEDIKKDMSRVIGVFGRRAAVYATGEVAKSTIGLKDYKFVCSPYCYLDCNEFNFGVNGSEAAIAELILCGTLYGNEVDYMSNHTLPEWIERINQEAERMNFRVNVSTKSMLIAPRDAWSFAIFLNNTISARDKEGLCCFTENLVTTQSNASIIGLEDPLYVLQTGGHLTKYIKNCTPTISDWKIAGCGKEMKSKKDKGSGNKTGYIVFYSKIKNLEAYCKNSSELEKQILVFDSSGGLNCAPGKVDDIWKACFNASAHRHFAGVINEQTATCGDCPSETIPFICGTCEMDEEKSPGGCNRAPGCDEVYITTGTCVYIVNDEVCDIHQVRVGFDSDELNTSCYMVSDVVEYYNSYCPDALSNGPSFFDRLDGNLNLSEKYVNQSKKLFGNELIGIESFINISKVDRYGTVDSDASWVDYLYWQGVYGCGVSGVCRVGNFVFNLDCPHARKFRVSTDCVTVRECEICGDQVCGVGENCVNCVSDCDCPGCPVYAGLTACGKSIGGNKYNVTFMLYVRDRNLTLFNLSGLPNITVTVKGFPALYTMSKAGSGIYSYTKRDVDKNYKILGNITLTQPLILAGCPTLTNRTEEKKASELSTC